MIEIDPSLLSADALHSLILEVLTRQSSDCAAIEINFEVMKNKLMQQLESGELVVVFYSEEGFCDIISSEMVIITDSKNTPPKTKA
ncbi:MAG: YheU family protein [Tatlockia sp.]|nr:YheU family protein [Tatlockia sp.]